MWQASSFNEQERPSGSASALTSYPPNACLKSSRLGRSFVFVGEMMSRRHRHYKPSKENAPWYYGWPGQYPPKKFWKRLRWRILCRDKFTCQYCLEQRPPRGLNVDHIVPVRSGGKSVPENLVTACCSCNKAKGNLRLPDYVVKEMDRGPLQETPYKANNHCNSCGVRGMTYQLFNADDPDYWMCGPCFGFLLFWKRKSAGKKWVLAEEPITEKVSPAAIEIMSKASETASGGKAHSFTSRRKDVSRGKMSAEVKEN